MIDKEVAYVREELERIASQHNAVPTYLSYSWFGGDDLIIDKVLNHLRKEGYDLVSRDSAVMFRHPGLKCKLTPYYCEACRQESTQCQTCGVLSCNEGLCPHVLK